MAASGAGRPDAATIADAPPGQNLSGPPVSGRGPLKLSYPRRSQLDSPVESSAGRLAGRSLLSSQENDRGASWPTGVRRPRTRAGGRVVHRVLGMQGPNVVPVLA